MRYLIGIDLGTTNSCVAYVDTDEKTNTVHSFKIPQIVSEGRVDALSTLPSFCYLSSPHEWPPGALKLPWQDRSDFFVGSFALTHGSKVPTRLVLSAKSWLCHTAANRRDRILPLDAADEASRISPVEATARYLRHIRESWNALMAKGEAQSEFDEQEIVLTVPASFDEVARDLTIEAAKLAGFRQMTLLEEPQAAFYSWIAQHELQWQQKIPVGSTILVCDVGGGTTDFSLIEVVEKEGKVSFQRMSVGDHLLLGGDNMDAALAHYLEDKMAHQGMLLNSTQRLQLLHEARKAKETVLQNDKVISYRVILQGVGSNVIKGTVSTDITQQEVLDILLKGFFGQYEWSEALNLRKTVGLRAMGLPYEDEPSITKHLAHFFVESGSRESGPKKPDFILFNGGTMKPTVFQDEILRSIQAWFPEKNVSKLSSFNLDLAVARGAAYYGQARHGRGIKIGGGIARGYYLIVDRKDANGIVNQKALTLLPRGSEEGASFEPNNTFLLTPNAPVSFQVCTSHVRLHDCSGELIEIDRNEMHFLPPIHTVLRYGKKQAAEISQEKIPVHLQIVLTPLGTVEMTLKSLKTEHHWKLEFQVKSISGQDNSLQSVVKDKMEQTFQSGFLKEAENIIREVYLNQQGKPEKLIEKLEEALNMPRREWPSSVLRGLADSVLKFAPQRKNSAAHAERWWNLIGFLLRPGFGYPLDDFRIKELWKVVLSDFKQDSSNELLIQQWICYRRIAGGLNKGQQLQIANDLVNTLLSKRNGKIEIKNKAELYPYSEKIRAFAALELIENALKIKIGNALVGRISSKEGNTADFWALGRLGARHLVYGSIVNVLPKEVCQIWIDQLLSAKIFADEGLAFLFGLLARKTEHRELNVSGESVQKILNYFDQSPLRVRLEELLLKENRLTQSEQDKIFGDNLPAALEM